MGVEPPGPQGQPDPSVITPTSEPRDSLGTSGLGDRIRTVLVWAGIVTVAILSILATIHLLADIDAVLGIRGGLSAVVARLLPVVLLAALGGVLALFVAWLAGSGRRREVAAIAIGLAALVVVRVFTAATMDGGTRGEPLVYGLVAESFLTPDPDLMGRPAGFPLLLAGAYSVVGDRQLATEIVNLLLAMLAGGAVLGLARGSYGARVGAVALLGYALWPAAAMMIVVRIPQTAYDLAVVASAWAVVGTAPGWRGSALAGGLLGLAQYLRPTTPILLPAYLVARVWPSATWRKHLTGAILPMVALFLVVLTPVMVYNFDRTGFPSIATSDYGGQTLYIGTYEPSGGTFDEGAAQALIDMVGMDPGARSEKGMEIALQRIKDDPVGMAALAIRKQDTLWGTEHYGVQYGIRQNLKDRPQHPRATTPMLLSQGFYVLVLVAALGGMLIRRRERDALIPLVTLLIWAAAALHALWEVRDRHHSYVVPLLLPLAALALVAVLGQVERRLGRSGGE